MELTMLTRIGLMIYGRFEATLNGYKVGQARLPDLDTVLNAVSSVDAMWWVLAAVAGVAVTVVIKK